VSGKEVVSRIVTAFEFLTIFGKGHPVSPQELGGSTRYFPIVGLACGLLLYLLHAGMRAVLPSAVVDVLLLAFLAIYSRGLHLDGYCDTIDAIAGGRDREHILEILRDSRIGALGVVGAIFLLLVKYVSLASLPGAAKPAVLVGMSLAAYWSMVVMAFCQRYARTGEGTGRPFTEHVRLPDVAVATGVTVGLSALFLGGAAMPLLVSTAVFVLLFGEYFRAKIGGVTGDIIGATKEIDELVFLVTALIVFR